jgi:cellulose biosynthesis protein BcsQ
MPFPFHTVATINFKGGVGKTTVTWCLANTAISGQGEPALLVDLDAQMSLTQAVALKEDGTLTPFGDWLEQSIQKKRTLFDAVESYTGPSEGHTLIFRSREISSTILKARNWALYPPRSSSTGLNWKSSNAST